MTTFLFKTGTFITLIAATIIIVQSAQAQNGRMNEGQMREMMQNAQKMQECMADIDQSAMEDLAARGKKVEAEVKALCKAGKRDEAQNRAMAYGKEVNASKEMQAMKKCGNMAQQMMKNSPWISNEDEKISGGSHICDRQ